MGPPSTGHLLMTDFADRCSALLRLRVWGERACFTRPEMKVERVSYDMMTPSAARGLLEAIMWKPQMRWIVERIDVLKPIRTTTVRRNEVGQTASVDNLLTAMAGRPARLGIEIEAARQQRASTFLVDVEYVIHARITLTPYAGRADTLTKYVEMFRRRAKTGQCFHRPYLGTREFAAEFALIDTGEPLPEPIALTHELGLMLLDIDYSAAKPVSLFFPAALLSGSLAVPDPESAAVRR
jgi:CRISPR-associated protein Cas5d